LLLLLLLVERVAVLDELLDTLERLLLVVCELLRTLVVAGAVVRELLLTFPLLRDTEVFALLLLRVTVVGVLLLRDTLVEVLFSELRTERVVAEFPLNTLASRPVELSTLPEDRVERFVFVLFAFATEVELRPDTELSLNDVLRPVVPVAVLRLEVAEVLRDEEATDELRPPIPPADDA